MTGKRVKKVEIYFFTIMILLISFPFFLYPQDSKKSDKNSQVQSNKTGITENKTQNKDKNNAEANKSPTYQFKAPVFEENKISYPMLILRTVAVLAIIVISIFVIFKIFLKSKKKLISDSEIIKVLATFPLAAGKIIQIVDIAGKVLVLGVTDSGINLITTIEDKEIIDSIKLYYSKEKAEKAGFKEQLLKLLGGKVFNKMGQISHLDNYRKRIKKMKKL